MRFFFLKIKIVWLAILIVCGVLCAPSSYAAGEATLLLTPSSGTFYVGSTFDVSIVLDTKGASINTAEIELEFSPDKLQLANPSVGQSIIQLWPAPPTFSNREGKIYFVGGVPSPGIVTSRGTILTLTFRVSGPGSAQIKFGGRTKILANDGKGTNTLGQTPSAFYRLSMPPPEGPIVSSPTHPDQERWYRDNNPVFVWPKGPFADAYSFSFDDNPSGFPDSSEEGIETSTSFKNVESGIRYFHLRERAGGVWGGVSHFAVRIDTEPPAAFKLNMSPGLRTSNRNPIARFFTTDSLSGFDHFELKLIPLSGETVSDALFFEVFSPYQFPNLDSGKYQIVVRALDRAENTRDETATLNILGFTGNFLLEDGVNFGLFFLPWKWIIIIVGLLLLILGGFVFLVWKSHKKHSQQMSQMKTK